MYVECSGCSLSRLTGCVMAELRRAAAEEASSPEPAPTAQSEESGPSTTHSLFQNLYSRVILPSSKEF